MARPRGAATRVYRRQPKARDRLWFSMRVLRRFSLPMLAETAEASDANARKYVIGLTRAGFLRLEKPVDSGRKGGHAVWILVRDPGPLAPRLQSSGQTYDPNRHLVHQGGIAQ